MKLVADEGVDGPIVEQLRLAGHEVTYFAEQSPGSSDLEILAWSAQEKTLLLTCDKDFGELVFRNELTMAGVVLLRLAGLPNRTKAEIVSSVIRDHGERLLGSFSVVAPGQLRVRSRLAPR